MSVFLTCFIAYYHRSRVVSILNGIHKSIMGTTLPALAGMVCTSAEREGPCIRKMYKVTAAAETKMDYVMESYKIC